LSSILSYSEDLGLSSELAAGGSKLSAAAGWTSSAVAIDGEERYPGGSVLLLKSPTTIAGDVDRVAAALAAAGVAKGAKVFLLGATRFGRQVAGKLAVRLGAPVLSDARSLELSEGRLAGSRGVYAGRFNARVSSPLPCIAVVPAGAYQAATGEPKLEELQVGDLPSRVRRVETRPKSRGSVDLRTAEVIVSAGRGFKKKEDLELAERLAVALGGVTGASRPLSSDLGWVGEERHIGLTGIYVRPKLYVAVGISGQLQHVAGIKDSKVIVAINKDKQAPIFQVADYGIVGDLYQVLPAILDALGPRPS
jgi:electron transfer flavoprotein alpha subunit